MGLEGFGCRGSEREKLGLRVTEFRAWRLGMSGSDEVGAAKNA